MHRLCLLVCAMTVITQAFFYSPANFRNEPEAATPTQQRSPLTVNPDEDCHIVDVVPLLRKKFYKSFGYKMRQLKLKPLTIEETFSPNKSVDLRIEQRGCEDVYAKFNFTFKDKKDRGIKYNLNEAAQMLKNLKLNPNAILKSRTIREIADAAVKESKKVRPRRQSVVCLLKTDSECITDVALKYEYPKLEIFYVDRP